MTITVRPAESPDFDRVGDLTVAAYLDGGFIPAESDYAETLRDARSRAEQAELWVAVDREGAVVGTITFAPPGSPLSEVAGPGEGELRMLASAPAARGRGVGESLVRHCIERARALGLTALALSTQPTMAAAHRIYERAGFERTPEKDWQPVPGVELLAYRLDLGPAD